MWCVELSSRDSRVAARVTTTASDGHRHVEEEDRLPGDVLDQEAADHGADGQRQGADAGPGADRLAALVRREGVGDDREGRRHHERGADALRGAPGDEPGLALREPDEGAREAEDDDAEEEHPPAAEDVAQAPAGDEQHGEAQRVGVDGPFEAADRRVQVLLDRRQRDVHDRVVEHDHEQREAHRAEGPPAAVVVGDGVANAGHERWGRSERAEERRGALLGGQRGGVVLEAGEAGGLDAVDDRAAVGR